MRLRCLYIRSDVRQTSSIAKLFFVLTTFSLLFFIILLQAKGQHQVDFDIIDEAISYAAQDARYAEVYRKRDRLPNSLKYILLWTLSDWSPFDIFGTGQKQFIKYNCSMINCYVTDDRTFLDNVTKYDAIAFNGRNLDEYDLPSQRSPHQKYIYFNLESPEYQPVCNRVHDGYFNWTSTYRLDSDIPFSYIGIKDINGNIVGPKMDIKWIDPMEELDNDFSNRLASKTKAAAWFVSNCKTKSSRRKYVNQLIKALSQYGLTVDIYGECGQLKCPTNNSMLCGSMLEREYYFYLSFENSFSEDYVTEKLLTALHHDTVPVVFGGANYSRYLPPGSYINARQMSPANLAATMENMMKSPILYAKFFKWRRYYTYYNLFSENVCAVCAALNNKSMVETHTVYENLRKWWHPNFESRCM